ncbi:MAG: helical backbone metal receptor, partial [Bacteroidota bacterium]
MIKKSLYPGRPIVRISGIFFCVIILLLTACGNDKNKELIDNAPLISQAYTDHTGRQISLPQAPQRVVSIAPNITEMIFAIDGQDKLVARSQACDYPEETADFPTVTTYPELSLEELKATEGDLIVTTDEIFSPDKIERISQIGIPIYLQTYKKLSDVYRGIRDLGILLQKEKVANQIADSLENLEAQITTATEGEVKYGTLILVSAYPEIIVVGGKGFLNEIIQKSGGRNLFADKDQAYYTSSVEEILSRNPEYLILPSGNDQVYAELINQYPALFNTTADKNKQVHVVNPDYFYRP